MLRDEIITLVETKVMDRLKEDINRIPDIDTSDDKGLVIEEVVKVKLEAIEQPLNTLLKVKESKLKSKLSEGRYTALARPTFTYAGIAIIAINYTVVPLLQSLFGLSSTPLPLPMEFWVVFGGVVGVYSVGRSYEKGKVKKSDDLLG